MFEPAAAVLGGRLRVFDHCVVRIGAIPSTAMAPLRAEATLRALSVRAAYREATTAARDRISELLHEAVAAAADRKTKNVLLECRRRLYQGRALSPSQDQHLASALDPDRAAAVQRYRALLDEARGHDALLSACAVADIGAARRALQRACNDEAFRRGLLLSSVSLFRALERYRSTPPEEFGARDEQIERGLLRYYSRTAMKATPFSALCIIAAGELVDNEVAPIAGLRGDPRATKGAVRLNKALYAILWDHLRQRPAVRAQLRVRSNPTLQLEGNEYVFLAGRGSRETFQRLARNEAIDRVVALAQSEACTTYGALSAALAHDANVDATLEDATRYVDKLEELGLLRLTSGVAEQEAEWDRPFCALLGAIDDQHGAIAASMLRLVRKHADAYVELPAHSREPSLEAMRTAIAKALEELGITRRLSPDLPLYEDVGTAQPVELDRALFAPALDTVVRIVDAVASLGAPRDAQASMRAFFEQHYGAAVEIPLLRFYEDFYRHHFKAYLEHVQQARMAGGQPTKADYDLGNPFGTHAVERMKAAARRIGELIETRWSADPVAEEIHISVDELEDAVGSVAARSPGCRSYNLFAQACVGTGTHAGRIVMPQGRVLPGYGKYFSRFLHVVPAALEGHVRQWNADATTELLVEICGDAHFNANLHPPLLSAGIAYPTGDGVEGDDVVACTEILARCDPEDADALVLLHRGTGRRVLPVDLGFLSMMMRPPLYQLLARFAPAETGSLPLPDVCRSEVPDPLHAARKTRYRPRIVVDNRVVVTRRRWTVPGSAFPMAHHAERLADLFVRVNEWRLAEGIPEQVYVRIHPLPAPRDAKAAGTSSANADQVGEGAPTSESVGAKPPTELEEAEELGVKPEPSNEPRRARSSARRDLDKPQFIDFASPLLVGLFARLPITLKHFSASLEERYPRADNQIAYGTETFAAELVLQVGTVPARDPAHGGA